MTSDIKLAVVASPLQPEYTLLGTGCHLCQAGWYLKYEWYRRVYNVVAGLPGNITILDWYHPTTASPGTEITVEDYFEVVKQLHPQELIIPDVFRNKEATLKSADDFLRRVQARGTTLMFVPQGKSFEEWVSCYQDADRAYGDYIDTIGIPKVLESFAPSTRRHAISHVHHTYKIHMLGVWNGADEVFYHPRIRSWDTSLPLAAAQVSALLQFHPDKKFQLNLGIDARDRGAVINNVEYLVSKLTSTPELLPAANDSLSAKG
jgi:hypothetical protein